jgi:hypothetical protein
MAAALVPGTGELVVPTQDAGLQFYDPVTDAHVKDLQVLSFPICSFLG